LALSAVCAARQAKYTAAIETANARIERAFPQVTNVSPND